MTSYGIPNNVQKALSKIRTDLDSFHDAEAYALMYSAYRQTCQMLADEKFDYLYINRLFKTDFKFKEIRDSHGKAPFEQPSGRTAQSQQQGALQMVSHCCHSLKKVVRLTAWIIAIGVAIYGISAVCSFLSVCVRRCGNAACQSEEICRMADSGWYCSYRWLLWLSPVSGGYIGLPGLGVCKGWASGQICAGLRPLELS
jgi:hypothetical protein